MMIWGEDLSTCYSINGYTFYVYGFLVSWSTKKQPTVFLSSFEVEYIAATQAIKKFIFLRCLSEEIQVIIPQNQITTIL